MKQLFIATVTIVSVFWVYGEICNYQGKQEILSQPITCTADRVTLSGKHYNKASIISLTCNGQDVTLGELRVGRIVNKDNVRVMGMVKQR